MSYDQHWCIFDHTIFLTPFFHASSFFPPSLLPVSAWKWKKNITYISISLFLWQHSREERGQGKLFSPPSLLLNEKHNKKRQNEKNRGLRAGKAGVEKQGRKKGRRKDRVIEDKKERERKIEGGWRSHALVQDGVSMVTSAGYQKIEAPSVCLRSALPLPIQKRHLSPPSAHNFIFRSLFTVYPVTAVQGSYRSKNTVWHYTHTHKDRQTNRQRHDRRSLPSKWDISPTPNICHGCCL